MSEHSVESISPEEDGRGSGAAERAPNTVLNGFIGGIVAVLLAFLPFSTVLGGAVAGYLEGGETQGGVKVGAIAGLVAFVPLALIILVAALLVPVTGPGMNGGGVLMFWGLLLAVMSLTALYTVALSILGGVIGVYVKEEI